MKNRNKKQKITSTKQWISINKKQVKKHKKG